MTQKPGRFRLHKRELLVVVMTTTILVGVVALLIGVTLGQETMDISPRFEPAAAFAKAKPAAAEQPRPARETPAVQPDPRIPVEVRPAPSRDEAPVPQNPTEAEAQEPPVAMIIPTSPRLLPEPTTAGTEFISRTIQIVAAIFAVAVVAPMVFAFCLFALLRRHSERFGALIQINHAITAPVGVAQLSTPVHAAPPTSVNLPAVTESHSPAYPLQDELPPPTGGALFEQLFEETLELQSQLDRPGNLAA